jgi:dienelactone hydrolase
VARVTPCAAAAVLALTLALSVAPAAFGGGFPRFGAGCSRADFGSSSSSVRAELCRGTGPVRAAVVVLHGCGGFGTFDHRLVTELPAYGIATLDIDYFALTPPPGTRGFCGEHGAAEGAFGTWVSVTRDAAAKLRAATGLRRVGVVGWSLGGGVAIAAAPRGFGAVAGFSTGAFGAGATARRLPPTILLSGGSTDAIPLAETRPLYDALQRARVPSELYVYPHGSHGWPGQQGALGIARAAAFLRRYLR